MQPLPDGHFVARVRGGDSSVRESDYRLALAVVLELMQDARTRREPVRVSAQNDVVILTGTVGSWDARRAAGSAARRAIGGPDVCNAVKVDAEAPDPAPADDFRAVVGAEVRSPASERNRSAAAMAVVVGLWLVLPWLVTATAIPAVPAVLAAVFCTGAALITRYVRSRF